MKPRMLKWTGHVTVLENEKNMEDFRGEVRKKSDPFECVNAHG